MCCIERLKSQSAASVQDSSTWANASGQYQSEEKTTYQLVGAIAILMKALNYERPAVFGCELVSIRCRPVAVLMEVRVCYNDSRANIDGCKRHSYVASLVRVGFWRRVRGDLP